MEYLNKILQATKKKDIFTACYAYTEVSLLVGEIFAIIDENPGEEVVSHDLDIVKKVNKVKTLDEESLINEIPQGKSVDYEFEVSQNKVYNSGIPQKSMPNSETNIMVDHETEIEIDDSDNGFIEVSEVKGRDDKEAEKKHKKFLKELEELDEQFEDMEL